MSMNVPDNSGSSQQATFKHHRLSAFQTILSFNVDLSLRVIRDVLKTDCDLFSKLASKQNAHSEVIRI